MNTTTNLFLAIIEDNEDDYQLLTAALQRDGVTSQWEWHQTGEAALTALCAPGRRDPLPHLIICDLDMSGMGGHAFLEQLRLDDRLRSTPVIIMTGSSSSDDRAYCPAADHYFIKPKNLLEWRVITSVVRRYAVRRSE